MTVFAIDVECPACHAAPGNPCKQSQITNARLFHTARHQAAAAAGKGKRHGNVQ